MTAKTPTRRALQMLDDLVARITSAPRPTFNLSQRRFLESRLAKLRAALEDERDTRESLRDRRQVAIVWGVEDVLSVRPDLTPDHAWEVLEQCEELHDSEHGFTWTHIWCVAGHLFPNINSDVDRS